MIKKLKCHCGEVEAEVKIPETGIEKFMRCNCSLCKRRGYIMTPINPKNFKLINYVSALKNVYDKVISSKFFVFSSSFILGST